MVKTSMLSPRSYDVSFYISYTYLDCLHCAEPVRSTCGCIRFVGAHVEKKGYLHDRQVESHQAIVRMHHRLFERSLWSYIHMYNRLPQSYVDMPSVSGLQAKLTHVAKERAKGGDPSWRQAHQDCGQILGLHGN